MLGPNFWRHPTHGLKKCSERTRDTCDDHLDCCAVTACTYCLELEIYGEAIQYGTADQSGNHWTGTVAGHYFDAYWDRNYTTDECEFVVELDSVEVYRNDCYGGQSCRDSSDEVGVTVGYDEATLRWIKHEPLPLPHIIDPDTGCKTWFCGECECSCDCVCVTITEPDGTTSSGELCHAGYDCEGPRWEGQIGYFDLALALGRDVYGNCVLESTVNGEDQDAVSVVGCKDMSATITLYDGTTIYVACKICACEEEEDFPCCPGTSFPSVLYLTMFNMNLKCPCFDGQVIQMMRVAALSPGGAAYRAIWAVPCATVNLCLEGEQVWYKFEAACTVDDPFPRIDVKYLCGGAAEPAVEDFDALLPYIFNIISPPGQCDPLYHRYTSEDSATAIFGACDGDDPYITTDRPWIEVELTR